MADLKVVVIIKDVNTSLLSAGFSRKVQMRQIQDPAFPDDPTKKIDEFPNVRLQAADFMATKLLKAANAGIDLLQQDMATKLTKDIFE